MTHLTRRRQTIEIRIATLVIIAIAGLGYFAQSHINQQVHTVRAEANTQVEQTQSELTAVLAAKTLSDEDNERLRQRLENTTSKATPETVKAVSRYYIKKYFGDEADYAEKVFTCESGLNPLAINKNTDKARSTDRGIAQLNDHWQKARFEKMMGVPFEVGAHDTDLNLRYAKWLWDNSGPGMWVCTRIVK